MHSMRSDSWSAAHWSTRLLRACRAAVLAVAAGLLAACGGGGGGGTSEQPVQVRNELTGHATSDGQTFQTAGISAKGASGPSRTNGFSGNPAQAYVLSTERLTPPFVIQSQSGGDYSVATANGRANVTQLTSLLTIALFGQYGADAFNDYGDASPAQIALVSESEIRRAQADATDFLERQMQVAVRSGDASFITTEFRPVSGDPMWDTIVELNRRITDIGPEAWGALLAGFQQRQHECRLAQVRITLDGTTTRLCPSATTSTPQDADAGVLRHLYTQSTGETLSLRVRGDTVIDATYVTAGGANYACSGAGCAGITLGPPAFDTTRSVVLTSVALTGADAIAMATGRLATVVPGIPLADLPCLVGVLHKIRADGSVESVCTDNSLALQILNVSGTLSGQQGASTHADYITDGISVVLDGARLVSVTAIVQSADGSTSVTAACRGADCQGVTIGAPTTNLNFGIPTDTRTVTLDGTALRAVAADGTLKADIAVRLKASLRLIYYSNVQFSYATPDDPPICTGPAVVAQLVPEDTPQWVYQVCSDGSMPIYGTPLDNGGLQISFNGQFSIDTDAEGRVVSVRVYAYHSGNLVGESFGCDGLQACRGVVVGAAAADGTRRVSMVGSIFHNLGFDGYASGPRTARVDADFVVVPPE